MFNVCLSFLLSFPSFAREKPRHINKQIKRSYSIVWKALLPNKLYLKRLSPTNISNIHLKNSPKVYQNLLKSLTQIFQESQTFTKIPQQIPNISLNIAVNNSQIIKSI